MKKRRPNGFTLIELIVTIAIICVVMVAMSNMMIDTLRAKNRVRLMEKIEQNGDWINEELRKNILKAPRESISCPINNNRSITFTDSEGEVTIVTCSNGTGIASASANPVANMVADGIKVSDCSSFATCKGESGAVTGVEILFTLSSGNANDKVEAIYSKTFQTKVTIRN